MFERNHANLERRLRDLGEIASPIIRELPNKVSGFISAMLCTPEGFNVCAMGFEGESIAKMAAVSSSLYIMARSILAAFTGKKDVPTHIITIQGDAINIIGKRIEIESHGPLILIIACNENRPGILLYGAQYVQESLQKKIKQ